MHRITSGVAIGPHPKGIYPSPSEAAGSTNEAIAAEVAVSAAAPAAAKPGNGLKAGAASASGGADASRAAKKRKKHQESVAKPRPQDSSEGEAAVCKVCARGRSGAGNKLLLCDGDGCTAAFHMLCLPRPLATVPRGRWCCPQCEEKSSQKRWVVSDELSMEVAVKTQLWAQDRVGLWGKTTVIGIEGEGAARRVRVRFKGFSAKFDEAIQLGQGRIRPLELGPAIAPGAAAGIYVVDTVHEVRVRLKRHEYLVSWKGYDDRTWEPEKNFISDEAKTTLREFQRASGLLAPASEPAAQAAPAASDAPATASAASTSKLLAEAALPGPLGAGASESAATKRANAGESSAASLAPTAAVGSKPRPNADAGVVRQRPKRSLAATNPSGPAEPPAHASDSRCESSAGAGSKPSEAGATVEVEKAQVKEPAAKERIIPVILPKVTPLPPARSWIYLDENQPVADRETAFDPLLADDGARLSDSEDESLPSPSGASGASGAAAAAQGSSEKGSSLGDGPTTSSSASLEPDEPPDMAALLCRRCFTYDCALHGIQQPRPRWKYRAERLSRAAEVPLELGGSVDMMNSQLESTLSCKPSTSPESATAGTRESERCYCKMPLRSRLYPAAETGSKKKQRKTPTPVPSLSSEPALEKRVLRMLVDEPVSSARRPSDAKKSGSRGVTSRELRLGLKHGEFTEQVSTACDHPGPCDKSNPACDCINKLNFCEVFCSCGPLCRNRWKGCRCKTNCVRGQCPCWVASRECDPDLCGCGAEQLASDTCERCLPPPRRTVAVTSDGGSASATAETPAAARSSSLPDVAPAERVRCRNVSIMLREQQPLLLGPSEIKGAGWGAFARDSLEKHTFVVEYTGELVSQREADRRGRVYDRRASSYLFNLNRTQVVDACPKGNMSRFLNHSDDANCEARIMTVHGDQHIGIYAKNRISRGEELFFDYLYDNDERQRFGFDYASSSEATGARTSSKKRAAPPKAKTKRKVQRQGSSSAAQTTVKRGCAEVQPAAS